MATTTIVIIGFGIASRILGTQVVSMPHVPDTNTLRAQLIKRFPELANIPFMLAVNQEMHPGNMLIPEGAEIAVMPPYSGG